MQATLGAMLLALALVGPGPQELRARELVVCGWDEVFILDLDRRTAAGAPEKTWSWRARDAADLPAPVKPLFNATDECKPLDAGRRILVTSSGGAVALVDRAAARVLFHGRAANAHSAEILPGERVAVAASHDPAGHGDRLIIFDLARPDQEVLSEELPWGHGVVWDQARQRLWALADRDIRVYRLQAWDSSFPALHREAVIPLPEAGGHDLSPVAGTPFLSVTTASDCWLFDRETRAFRRHPALAGRRRVKGVSHHPVSGQIAFVEAEGSNWWAERIHLLDPAGVVHLPGERLYKARWVPGPVQPAAGSTIGGR